jgi:hypothetical protein
MDWKMCIVDPKAEVLILCHGLLNHGMGYGTGYGYGDGLGDGLGDGIGYGMGNGWSRTDWED